MIEVIGTGMGKPFELQHSTTPQPRLLDIDPVSAAPWPLPPVKRWEPVSGFDLDAMCQEARERLLRAIDMDAMFHACLVRMEFTRVRLNRGIPW